MVKVRLRNPDIILMPITDEEKKKLKKGLGMKTYIFYIDYQIQKEFILV